MREIIRDLGPIQLGRFLRSDFNDVHAFASDIRACRYQAWGPNTPEDTEDFLDGALNPDAGDRQLAVLRDGKVIGSARVWTTSTSDQNGEIGYTLHPDEWGHGFGSLVAQALVQIAFTEMGLQRVAAVCRLGNVASIRVLEKAGLRREGCLRGAVVVIRGERQDSLVFGVLVTD